MNHHSSEKGQALILITFAAIGLFAFAALAIDGSMVFSDKRHAQNAADTAALAGALAHSRGQDISTTAKSRALSNGYNDDTTTNVVDVHVSHLRGKVDKDFEPKLLHTVKGVGYVLEDR